jgi:hypothetical protein
VQAPHHLDVDNVKSLITDEMLEMLVGTGLLHSLAIASAADARPTKPEGVLSLDLSNTRMTNAGLKLVMTFKKLTRLDLRCAVTDTGVTQFKKALPNCKIGW